MDIVSLADRLPTGAGWTMLVILVIAIFGSPAILSRRTVDEKLGGLGRIASWWAARSERAIQREIRIDETKAAAIQQRLEDLTSMYEQTRDDLMEEIEQTRADLREERNHRRAVEAKLESMLEESMGYIEWSTTWARSVILAASEHGWHPPIQPWLSFPEWKAQRSRAATGK